MVSTKAAPLRGTAGAPVTELCVGTPAQLPQRPPVGKLVISMRQVRVFARGLDCEVEQLEAGLHGRWRQSRQIGRDPAGPGWAAMG